MLVKRSSALPENDMAIIKDMDMLVHNIVTPEIKEKNKEIQELKNKVEELSNTLKDIEEYVNFLVIFDQTINGKFSETVWGQEILSFINENDKENV